MEMTVKGKHYNSEVAMCKDYGIYLATYRRRIKQGMSTIEALTTPITDHLGNVYKSEDEMCAKYGKRYSYYSQRIRQGWTQQRALEQPMSWEQPIKYTDGSVKILDNTGRAILKRPTKIAITFEDIYNLWIKYTKDTNLDKPIPFKVIYIEPKSYDHAIHGYDWLQNYKIEWYTKKNPSDRLATLMLNANRHGTRKGDVDTLRVLARERDNKKRAAIWIAAYICEEFGTYGDTETSVRIYRECIDYLRYRPWDNMQRAWLPKHYIINLDKRNATPDDIIKATFETIINLYKNCKPVLFTSRKEYLE